MYDIIGDIHGHFRISNSIKWWKHPREHTHDAVLFNCPAVLYNQPLPPDITFNVYPADAPPVFFGHYWLEDKIPAIQSHNVICLDYSVAKGGSLVAYRQGLGRTTPHSSRKDGTRSPSYSRRGIAEGSFIQL